MSWVCCECGSAGFASLDLYVGRCAGLLREVPPAGAVAFEPGGHTEVIWDSCEQFGWVCGNCAATEEIAEAVRVESPAHRERLLQEMLERMTVPGDEYEGLRDAAEDDSLLVVCLPAPHHGLIGARLIERGSGMVRYTADADGVAGSVWGGDKTTWVDYEGPSLAVNIRTWADRVYHAYDRARSKYPTSKRMVLRRHQVVDVGVFDGETVTVFERRRDLVADWVGVPVGELDAQLVTS